MFMFYIGYILYRIQQHCQISHVTTIIGQPKIVRPRMNVLQYLFVQSWFLPIQNAVREYAHPILHDINVHYKNYRSRIGTVMS